MSRPVTSVPKGCSSEGGCSDCVAICVVSAAVGEPRSCGAQRSAVMATRATKMIQTAAMMASLFWRRRLQASPQSVREAPLPLSCSWATASAVASMPSF